MTFNQGWDFRLTSGFVVDPANTTWWLPGDVYPVNGRGSAVFGSLVAMSGGNNDNAGIDPRLAGTVFNATGVAKDLRIDLPAPGTYQLFLAFGSAHDSLPGQDLQILDGATVIAHPINNLTSHDGLWRDATATEYSAATWPGSQTPILLTFATTTCILRVGANAFETIAHVRLVQVGGSAAITGTGAAGISGDEVRAGGKTLIVTLTGDTFLTIDDTKRQAFVDAIVAATSPAWGWNAVRASINAATAVVATSSTVWTLTLPPLPNYQSDTTLTLTDTVPASILTGGVAIVATPTIAIARTVTDLSPVGDYDMTGTATKT